MSIAARTATKWSINLRNHDVPETQGGEENLAEGSDINDARITIQPLQRRDGHALKAILTVVVVLDDPRSELCAQFSNCMRRVALMVDPRGY